MNDNLPATSPSTIEVIGRDGYGWIDAALVHLDDDPSINMVEQMIGHLADIGSKARHAIGEILVFIRYRSQFHTVATFPREGNLFPDEVVKYIHQHYNQSPGEEHPVEPFLAWEAHKFTRFWLLVSRDEIRVWERGLRAGLEDDAFDSYLTQLAGRLREVLDENTLRSYYRVAMCFPREQIIEGISWTAHLEATNVAANVIPPSVGEERWRILAEKSQEVIGKLADEGAVSVARVREKQRKVAAEKRGFTWLLPPIPNISVAEVGKDSVVRAPIVALEFHHPLSELGLEACTAILYWAGIGRQYGRNLLLVLNGDRVELASGEVVASIPYIDNPLVDRAISSLAGKMEWRVKR